MCLLSSIVRSERAWPNRRTEISPTRLISFHATLYIEAGGNLLHVNVRMEFLPSFGEERGGMGVLLSNEKNIKQKEIYEKKSRN